MKTVGRTFLNYCKLYLQARCYSEIWKISRVGQAAGYFPRGSNSNTTAVERRNFPAR